MMGGLLGGCSRLGLEDGKPYIVFLYRHLICMDFVTIIIQCIKYFLTLLEETLLIATTSLSTCFLQMQLISNIHAYSHMR